MTNKFHWLKFCFTSLFMCNLLTNACHDLSNIISYLPKELKYKKMEVIEIQIDGNYSNTNRVANKFP